MYRTRLLLAIGLALVLTLPSLARAQADEAGVEYDRTVIELDIAPEWTSRTGSMIAADLDGAGMREVVVSQKGEPDHLVAVTTTGETLWSRTPDLWLGEKTENEGLPGLHGPGVQAGDVDADGETEVLFVNGSGRLVLIDGATGERERSLELPAVDSYYGRWEHAVIADFEDDADVDVLLQASKDVTGEDYLKGTHIAAYSMPDLLEDGGSAEAIFERHDFHSPGHSVAGVADLDGDGRDEVLGADLVDDDGEKLVSLGLERASRNHIDSYQYGDVDPDRPGLEVAAAKQGGGNEVVLYDAQGIIWRFSRKSGSTDGDKVQIGDFDPDRRGMEIYLRGKESNDQWVLGRGGEKIADYLFDEQAPDSWTDEGVEAIWDIQWSGNEKVRLAAKERHERGDVAIYDAMDPSREFRQLGATVDRLFVADVTDDWREEVLVLTGDELHVYRNTASNPRPDRRRPWENRTYRLDRATWNYYSP